jgi:tetratricopeptide (TPR) repeat protein
MASLTASGASTGETPASRQGPSGLFFRVPDTDSIRFTTTAHRFQHVSADPFHAVEREFQKLLRQAAESRSTAERLLLEANRPVVQSRAPAPRPAGSRDLAAAEEQRVAALFDQFLARHPGHSAARLIYSNLLLEYRPPEEALAQLQLARQHDPSNPLVCAAIGHHQLHFGQITNALLSFARALELNPYETANYQNLATTLLLYRNDVRALYRIDDQEIFDHVSSLMDQAVRLEPFNYMLAYDVAETYYNIKPLRPGPAIGAWLRVLKSTRNPEAWQGVYLHLARIEVMSGRLEDARRHLSRVTLPVLLKLKERVRLNLDRQLAVASTAPSLPEAGQ